jgi:hypothetical protein
VSLDSAVMVFNCFNGKVLPPRKSIIEFRSHLKAAKATSRDQVTESFAVYHNPVK